MGTNVTERQFRRYVTEGVIPADQLKKDARGWWVLIQPPQTQKEWSTLAQSIENWRSHRYRRGWSRRPRKKIDRVRLNADDRSVGIVTIEGVHMQFKLWLKKVREDDGFPGEWDDRRLGMVRELIKPIAEVYEEIGQIIENREPKPQQ